MSSVIKAKPIYAADNQLDFFIPPFRSNWSYQTQRIPLPRLPIEDSHQSEDLISTITEEKTDQLFHAIMEISSATGGNKRTEMEQQTEEPSTLKRRKIHKNKPTTKTSSKVSYVGSQQLRRSSPTPISIKLQQQTLQQMKLNVVIPIPRNRAEKQETKPVLTEEKYKRLTTHKVFNIYSNVVYFPCDCPLSGDFLADQTKILANVPEGSAWAPVNNKDLTDGIITASNKSISQNKEHHSIDLRINKKTVKYEDLKYKE